VEERLRFNAGGSPYARPRGSVFDARSDCLSPAFRASIGGMIKGLHHSAYRCRNSEATRAFYEDFLGLPLSGSLVIEETKSGRKTKALHTFYRMDDGSFLAFFEAPDMPFAFKSQHDFDLHIALEVAPQALKDMFAKGKAAGTETRGVSDHGFIDSIYFRDPNGYVVELTAKRPNHDQAMDPARNRARDILDQWTSERVAIA
jgi:catechol 2,3-dioxygenase-like lactoylglutathione lyase family enzyme